MDCILLCGPKDEDIIQDAVNGVATHLVDVRYIYVIATRKLNLSNCVVFEESPFPFTREQVAAITSEERAGWYLQQLIKFYAPLLISSCSENLLVLDGDTIFYKRVRFTENTKFLFDIVRESPHLPYFEHMSRLHPSFLAWKRQSSGIVKYGVWNKKFLIEMMEKVEEYHKKDFWLAFLDCIEKKQRSGANAYEIYWHYVMRNYTDRVRIRPLRWNPFGQRWEKNSGDYQYVSYPWHLQRPNPLRR